MACSRAVLFDATCKVSRQTELVPNGSALDPLPEQLLLDLSCSVTLMHALLLAQEAQ